MVKQIDINLGIIQEAFTGDKDIFKYCDPEFEGNSVEELAEMIYKKIMEHTTILDVSFHSISDGEGLIGYFFCSKIPNLLISFGISPRRRTPEVLESFVKEVRTFFNREEFECFLFTRNKRAISFLKKNGMKYNGKFEKLTKLYMPCQQED